jgi:uncharacterized membrane protein YdbT with pleckstrin-like domain
MDKSAIVTTPAVVQKEKILFEIKSIMLPTILNFENLATIGFVILIVLAFVAFPGFIGWVEIVIIGAFFLLFAVPSFRSIFLAGSTTYVLTNRRLIIFTVGLGQKERSIPLENIQSVKCKPSGLQRFYRAGDILVKQKGFRRATRLLGIGECRKRADQIEQAMRKAASK